jgi:O-acetyl-ADP-ribose deacetylase (regulator of RNase III)
VELRINGHTLRLIQGDITALEVEAIVNPANSALVLGGGVAGAIRAKGGETIQAECDRIGSTPVGTAVMTTGGNLKADYVIHAVGPRWGEGDEEAKLAGAVGSALELASEKGLRSIALPAISTGIFGFPLGPAARITLRTVKEHLRGETALKEVILCLFGPESFEAFKEAAREEK